MGSVGTSLIPVRVTTFFTSGNFSNKILDALEAASIDVLRLLPDKTLVSTAKSPSGNEGINSPPNLVNKKIAKANNTTTDAKTFFLWFKIFIKFLWYTFSKRCIILSEKVALCFNFLLNTKLLIIGI